MLPQIDTKLNQIALNERFLFDYIKLFNVFVRLLVRLLFYLI